MSRHKLITVIAALGVATLATPVSAQVLGSFPWQMQPYCNIVTLTLTSAPAGFTLDGTDDQCGATNKASAVGVASFNQMGNVTLNFTIVTAPAGKPVHVSAVVSPANGAGTWTDSVGNGGTFAFFSNTPGLPARPLPASGLPASIITTVELAPNAVTSAKVADGSLTSADLLDGPRATGVSGNHAISLTPTDVVVRSVTLTAPTAGKIIAHASGFFRFQDTTATNEVARCSITNGTALDFEVLILQSDFGSTLAADVFSSFGGVRLFNVAAGSFVVNLVCDEYAGNTSVERTSLVALFVPQ